MSSEPSETPTFAEETANTMLNELQSWWEIPSVAQYISLFREAFNLPEIEIEELEKGLIDDTIKGPNEWLQNLVFAFLKSIMPTRVNAGNWEVHLRRLIRRKWCESPFAEKENPFLEEIAFHELKLRSKVEVLYCFCLFRLDSNDIAELMKSMDAEALRVQKLGVDDAGSTYWYFYGTRLYKEEAIEEKKTWDEEWNEQKRKSLEKKRGRGRPRKNKIVEKEPEDTSNDDKFMNVSGKSRWSVVCDTLEEWVNFAEKFKNSKSKNEKSIFTIIQENFLPTLNKLYEEKERKLQQKIKELLPAREKIVTRRETRRMRGDTGGDINYALLNGYDSDEDNNYQNEYQMPVVKDRAQRLEERNKRASETDAVQYMPSRKRTKQDEQTKESSNESSLMDDITESGEVDIQSQMVKLIISVKLHKDAWPFLHPVNESEAPGYYEIIKDPVDLSTIENRLYKGEYETIGDLDEDFSKMVSNCELYNGENHAYSKMAQTLRKLFRREIANLLERLEVVESSNGDSEEGNESNDSQYHSSSNSNSSSPPHEPSTNTSKEHRKPKGKKKKKKHHMEALDLLAQASDVAVQDDNMSTSSSSVQNKSPPHEEIRPTPYHVPSANMFSNSASSSLTSSSPASTSSPSSSINKTVRAANVCYNPVNSSPQAAKKVKPLIIRAKASEVDKRVSPTENVNTSSNKNSNNTLQQTNVNQTFTLPKTAPAILSRSSPNQSDSRIVNPLPAVTMQSNMRLSNGLPVVQQVVIPAGSQLSNSGQFVFASPQNTVRLLSNEQSMQLQNSIGQLNQGFVKVVPQLVSSAPNVVQLSKGGVQNVQFQTLPPNSTQTFTQVVQNPQFVSVPQFVVANQNSSQPTVNFQQFQMPPRQMQITGQGNG